MLISAASVTWHVNPWKWFTLSCFTSTSVLNTDFSALILKSDACSCNLVYRFLEVSPTYMSPHSSHFISYVTLFLLHLLSELSLHNMHSLSAQDLSTNVLECCSFDFRLLPSFSMTLILLLIEYQLYVKLTERFVQ